MILNKLKIIGTLQQISAFKSQYLYKFDHPARVYTDFSFRTIIPVSEEEESKTQEIWGTVKDVDNLSMWLSVNGKKYQNSNTSNLVFKIPFLVHYLSQFMTLLPGDVISTGTPPGVGLGIKPEPIFLKAGDLVELGIEGLGTSKQLAVAYQP